MKTKRIVRKYAFASLVEYFEYQVDSYDGIGASRYTETSRDTHARLAERLGVTPTTISRIVAKLSDPSYPLALKISKDVDCPPDAMGRSGVA